MYQSYYNLTGKPFRLSPDPSFFFPSRGHKRALAYLRYGLNQDEGFVVITGAPGTGKTTLAKILLHEMGEKDVVVAHLTTTQLEADDMLRMVTASFGLRYEDLDKAQLLKSLESFLLARSREHKRALLVIDEAQNLPTRSLEELRMLSNLQVGDKALVQTFLLGQAQFRTLLDRPELEQLRQRIIANYHLSPLAADESKRYIESRLQQVGWVEDPTFAELAYEKIYEYTEGIPRRINMLCDRVLLYSCMEEIHEITSEVIDMVTNELDQEVSGMPVSAQSAQMSASQMKNKAAQSVAVKSKAAIKKSAPVLDEATQAFDSEDFNKYKKNKKEDVDQKTNAKPKKPVEEATQQIMGNTVAQAQQKPKSNNQDTRDTTEIPERDLFRVIPGGKKHEQAPEPSKPNQPMAPAASAKPTPEDIIQRRILRLVLVFYRSLSCFPGLDNPHQPLPEGITELLELAIADDQVLTQVSPAAVMGISPAMLRAAVRFFVRRALFVVDGDDFRVLGLRSTASQADVEKHYDLLMRLLRQDKQRGTADSVARVGQAYENLSRIDQAKQYVSNDQPDNDTLNIKATARKKVKISTSAQPSAAARSAAAANMPVDKTLSVKLNKTGNIDTQQGPEFEIEEGEMTIDFDTVVQHANGVKDNNIFARKPNEIFTEESRFSRKSMRFAGQFAVLGFGALVIILGLYIVQLEPSDTAQNEEVVVKKLALNEQANKSKSESGRRDLRLSDGSSSKSDSNNDMSRLEKEKSDLISRRDALLLEASKARRPSSAKKEVSKPRQKSQQLATYADLDSAPTPTPTPKPSTPKKKESKAAVFSELPETSRASSSATDIESTQLETLSDSSEQGQLAVAPIPVPVPTTTASAPQPRSLTEEELPVVAETASDETAADTTAVPAAIQASTTSALTVLESELNATVSKFVESYESGDVNRVMSVFASNARTNTRKTPAGIRTDYVDLFNSTSFRVMNIQEIRWEIEGDHARGVGNYQAKINPSGTNNSQTFLGDVTIQARKSPQKGVEITRFYFNNQKVSSGPRMPEAGQTVAVVKPQTVSVAPSVNELNALVANFVQSYDRGNIEGIMNSFAEGARTNDQTTLAGIRKDHIGLFNSTSVRQMTIDKVTWTFNKDTATGVANFVVLVQATNNPNIDTYKGTISLSAKKSSKGVLFTQMLHNLQ